MDHTKNNSVTRGRREHVKTEKQKENDKKLGATDDWKDMVSSPGRIKKAMQTSVPIDEKMKAWLKSRGYE